MFKKIMSLLLAAVLSMGGITVAAEEIDTEKSARDVYVRANDTASGNSTTVYMGDDVNVYLAVDNPNKGAYDESLGSEDIQRHTEPQYDMNGYIVKFYYDPEYFTLIGNGLGASGIDYTIPLAEAAKNDQSELEGQKPNDVDPNTLTAGFYVHAQGSEENVEKNGKKYNTAYATILFNGIWLPQKTEAQGDWYNLCALPLKPKKTGTTEVFIEENDTQENFSLELLAKDKEDYPVNFTFTAENGGRHTIIIKPKLRPDPPVAEPPSGEYVDKIDVTLTSSEPDCNIYYTTVENPGDNDWKLYSGPITVTTDTNIKCYAERKSDGMKSDTVTYSYTVIPPAPKLFLSPDGTNAPPSGTAAMPEIYNSNNPFRVYAATSETYAAIQGGDEVYYTYSRSLTAEDAQNPGSNPNREWVKLDNAYSLLDITETCEVRLIAKRNGEWSYMSFYYLGIRPDPAIAEPPESADGKPVRVTLTSETRDADIYYTLDGSDPRSGGMPYKKGSEIKISHSCTLRTVAVYKGVYSEVLDYTYIIDPLAADAVVEYPSEGTYEDEIDVRLSSPTGCDIWYTTDGSDPSDPANPNRKKYDPSKPPHIDKDTTVKASSDDGAGGMGTVYDFAYIIRPSAPVIEPPSTQFSASGDVTVYSAKYRDGYILYYTLDGSDPRTSDTRIEADGDRANLNITQYTEVSAVVYNGEEYSEVVTETYDIIGQRPPKPMTSLKPGYYTVENGSSMKYTTEFLPVPDGVTIYYTIGYKGDGRYPPADPNYGEWIEYVPGTDIDLHGEAMIKAVAVNAYGIRSDMGIFQYVIQPDAPTAPQSATLSKLAPIPVDAAPGSEVTYTANGFENTVTVPDNGRFYIDPETGNAYDNPKLTGEPLGTKNPNNLPGTGEKLELTLSSKLDGVESGENSYRYSISPSSEPSLAAPFADKPSGTYEKTKDGFNVTIDSLNPDADIEYSVDGGKTWLPYTDPIPVTDDTVLQTRAKKDGVVSNIASYIYDFVPPAPIITPVSGIYGGTVTAEIKLPEGLDESKYEIYYSRSGDDKYIVYPGGTIEFSSSSSVKAYIVEKSTGERGKGAAAFYIINVGEANGSVIAEPEPGTYEIKEMINGALKNGIALKKAANSDPNAALMYRYTYTLRSTGDSVSSPQEMVYTTMPISVMPSMGTMTITAWLADENGAPLAESEGTFEYIFYDETEPTATPIPTESPAPSPEPSASPSPTPKVTSAPHGGGGGGGGRYATPTPSPTVKPSESPSPTAQPGTTATPTSEPQKYTIDYFGDEQPNHWSYINGYPDGEVKPENNISREEIAQIVYNILKRMGNPASSAGQSYPDVDGGRWSAAAIDSLTDTNILNGYPDGEFKPDRDVTRAEFCTMISNWLDIEPANNPLPFTDMSDEHWAYANICALYEAGIISGYEDMTFMPDKNLSRAEAVCVIDGILGRAPLREYLQDSNFNPFPDLYPDKWYFEYVLEAAVEHTYTLDADGFESEWHIQ